MENFPNFDYFCLSTEFMDLLERMLLPQNQRITLEEILEHPWIRKTLLEGLEDGTYHIGTEDEYVYEVSDQLQILSGIYF